MTQRETIQALKSRFEKIQASFDSAIAYLDAEDIHAFRVDVKKLRAFLRLAPGKVKVKLPKRLHQFYRLVGLIRNLQLQELRIRDAFPLKSALPQSYLNLLAIETAAAIRRARKFAAGKLPMPAIERELFLIFSGGLTKDTLQRFTRDTVDRLENHGNNRRLIDDDSLHSLRKCLKDLRSGLLFLQPRYTDQVADAGERKMLEGIRAKWEKDKAAIKAQVLSLLKAVQLSPVRVLRRMTLNASSL
jgi:CHAD domain-containing protein